MLYLILKESQYNNLSKEDRLDFIELPTSSMIKDFVFVNYIKSDLDECIDRLINDRIFCKVVEPYISVENFKKIFKDSSLVDCVKKTKLEYSFFEDLISGYAKIFPKYETEYILLSESKEFDEEELLTTIREYNYKLFREKILLNEYNVKPSLTDLYLNSFDRVIEEEANSEFILTEDIKKINSEYDDLISAEFLIQASKHYSKKDIIEFVEKKLIN